MVVSKAREALTLKTVQRHLWKEDADPKPIANDLLYSAVERLVSGFRPTSPYTTELDKRWLDLFLPVMDGKNRICLPFGVVRYKGVYFVHFGRLGRFSIKGGDESCSSIYFSMLETAESYKHINDVKELEKRVPLWLRKGKIVRKYLIERSELLDEGAAKELLKRYEEHKSRDLKSDPICLDRYLEVAAICYRAIYGENGAAPQTLYETYADGRHGGMLEIKGRNSVKQFNEWLQSTERHGTHPFEIVAGARMHGIELDPPGLLMGEGRKFLLTCDDPYWKDYLEVLNALIDANIPFEAPHLLRVLKYATGESCYTVNAISEHSVDYGDLVGNAQAVEHIKWDKLKVLKRLVRN